MQYLIGIDEAGRGPLAGPVAVGAVMVPRRFRVRAAFPDARDSKVLSAKMREEIYEELTARVARGDLYFCVRFVSNARIDRSGITKAVRRAVDSCLKKLSPEPSGARVLLDGLLHAPPAYEQETIIHGDALEPLISLASIVAKVRRDRLMERLAKKFPLYGFDRHKGYGTRAHRAAIRSHGLCELHRATFCKQLLLGPKSV